MKMGLSTFSILILLVFASAGACSETSNKSISKAESSCTSYSVATSSIANLEKSQIPVLELDKLSHDCVGKQNQVNDILKQYFKFNELTIKRDFQNSMSHTKTSRDVSVNIQLNNELRFLNKIDSSVLQEILTYIIEHDAYGHIYGASALEIIARLYPSRYPDYWKYFKNDPDGVSLWKATKEQWIHGN